MGWQVKRTCSNCLHFEKCKHIKPKKNCGEWEAAPPPPPPNTGSSVQKGRTTRLLTMDELHARPCEVDRALLNIDVCVAAKTVNKLKDAFQRDGVVPSGCSIDVIRETFALVEYGDGTIDKVKPELIRFIREEGQRGT